MYVLFMGSMIVESWDLFFSSYFPQPYGEERERKWTAAD